MPCNITPSQPIRNCSLLFILVLAIAGETKEGYYQPLEKAELVREGGDVTILCYSRMRYVVMQAVQTLEKQGFDPEVFTSCTATSHAVGCMLLFAAMLEIHWGSN